jgi:hypothetical protein
LRHSCDYISQFYPIRITAACDDRAMEVPTVEELLATPMSFGGKQRAFGSLEASEIEARAEELGSATGFGHRSRVGAVSAAWRELARLMAEVTARAERLWIVPPGGSLLP